MLPVHAAAIRVTRTCHRLLLLLQEASIARAGRGRGIAASEPLEGLIAIHCGVDEVSSPPQSDVGLAPPHEQP